FYSFFLFSQDIDYSRKVIDTLASEYFSGRGAVNNGEKKAADYIVKHFKFHGLKPFNNSYLQEFKSPINTFPGEMEVSFNDIKLVPGEDFLVDPSSGQINGTFKIVWYTNDNVPTKKQLKKLAAVDFFRNKFIVIDDAGFEKENEIFSMLRMNLFGAVGIINIEDNKLTQSLSSTHNDFAILTIKRESIDRLNKTINVSIQQKFIRDYQSQNVIGYVQGTEFPDSFIILSAHYDHSGKMGSAVYFPGANDNASGVAMLLNLAYHYTHKEPPTKTVIFIAFGAEEAGLVGSKYFVENPIGSLNKINFVFNMDLMGTGSEGAMIVNGAIFENRYNKLTAINKQNDYLPIIKKRGKAANSDHYWFSENGVPSFFMYTMGGIKAYHDIEDISKTLPLTEFEDSFRLICDFVDEL
ncbi:MAG: M28 family peptidase, partial [Opitutaceae bacterium]|nr:M28 family peptidase [Opitutaceae bacterium]